MAEEKVVYRTSYYFVTVYTKTAHGFNVRIPSFRNCEIHAEFLDIAFNLARAACYFNILKAKRDNTPIPDEPAQNHYESLKANEFIIPFFYLERAPASTYTEFCSLPKWLSTFSEREHANWQLELNEAVEENENEPLTTLYR